MVSVRRPPGSGSVYRETRGKGWLAVVILADRRRVSKLRPTRELAEAAVDELIAAHATELGYFYSVPHPFRWGERKRQDRAIPPSLRLAILERDGYACAYCGASAPEARLVIDHVIPIADEGTDDPTNLTTACEECNVGKGGRRLLTLPAALSERLLSKG